LKQLHLWFVSQIALMDISLLSMLLLTRSFYSVSLNLKYRLQETARSVNVRALKTRYAERAITSSPRASLTDHTLRQKTNQVVLNL